MSTYIPCSMIFKSLLQIPLWIYFLYWDLDHRNDIKLIENDRELMEREGEGAGVGEEEREKGRIKQCATAEDIRHSPHLVIV